MEKVIDATDKIDLFVRAPIYTLGMNQNPANKFIAALAIIATPFALGAFILTWAPSEQFHRSDPEYDGYVQPRDVGGLVAKTQESTVTVYCEKTDEDYKVGTGWAIDLKNGMDKKNPTTLITNHHVIDQCIGKAGKLTVAELYEDEVPAYIVKWDEENDLAVLATGLKLKPLELSQAEPWPGYWVMVLGSADGYQGSVAFGATLNTTDYEIFITANTSSGNSGGPLIDNEGRVIGTTSWGHKSQQYNGAMSLNAMCAQIIECDGEFYWERE
jgi:serine protease Do